MDAARRRIRAVSAHLSPPAPAAGSGLDANPTAGEYAHGASPYPCVSFHLLLPCGNTGAPVPCGDAPDLEPAVRPVGTGRSFIAAGGQPPSPDSEVVVGMWRGGPGPAVMVILQGV